MKNYLLIFLFTFTSLSAFTSDAPDSDFKKIKNHIKNTTKIEIIFDLNKEPTKGFDKEKKIWIIPDSNKVIITDKKEIEEIKKLITYEKTDRHFSEGKELIYFWYGDQVLYTTFIDNIFAVYIWKGKKIQRYKFKMSKKLIDKIYSYKKIKKNPNKIGGAN